MKSRKMRGRVGEEGERSQFSWQGPRQPCHGYSLVYGGGEGSEAAEDGGCDGGVGGSCSQQGGGLHDHFDRNVGVGLPISGPAVILEEAPHPGG